MKNIRLIFAALAIAAIAVPAAAQNGNPPGQTHPTELQTNNWMTTGSILGASNAAAQQPEMATGIDLKGPPKRFPANQTPE